jgi:DNA-directed RNA polymerase sigma subunit (sigma70/sigma32)
VKVKKLPQHYKDKVKKDMTVMTAQEVADKLGVSKAAVLQVERKALAKAKRIVKARVKQQDILPD